MLGALSLLFCTVNFEKSILNVDWNIVLYTCTFSMQLYVLATLLSILLSNKIYKKWFPFFIVTVLRTVLYILFYISQLMTVYPFEHIKELKQFRNMYTTSLTVKTYFETVHDWSLQTELMRYHVSRNTLYCPGNPLISGLFK